MNSGSGFVFVLVHFPTKPVLTGLNPWVNAEIVNRNNLSHYIVTYHKRPASGTGLSSGNEIIISS